MSDAIIVVVVVLLLLFYATTQSDLRWGKQKRCPDIEKERAKLKKFENI